MHSYLCIFAALVFCLLFHKNQAYRNLVVSGLTTATQSSNYRAFSADRSIDGYPDRLTMLGGSCSHTEPGQTQAWLRIRLDKVYNVKKVRFWYRNDRDNSLQSTIRLHYYSLYFYNKSGSPVECYRDNTDYSTPIPMPSTIECPSKTRTILFYTSQPNPQDGGQVFLEICEVEIYGCDSNQYGENCYDCNNRCTDCDIIRGCVSCQGKFTGSECDLCLPGYMGNNCECINGTYGLGCLENCSGNCFENQTCDYISGTCQNGCRKGWTGSKCFTSCSNGTYGENCRYNCSRHCFQNETCNRLEGYCPNGCDIGWDGEACDRACPEYSFGRDCLEKCGRCVNNTCNHVNGSCSGPCQDGWEGEGCLLAKDDLESPLERSYSFLLEAVAGTGALVAIIAVAAILIFWIRHKKTHFTGEKSAHADKKDLEQEMSLHPETSGIYENQDGCSSSAERQNSSTRELPNNPTDRPMYEVNKDERSTEEYETLSNNPTDQPMYEVINKGERSTEEYDTLEL